MDVAHQHLGRGQGAFHYRLVASLVDHGRLPDPDSLSDLPAGRHLGRFLPLGLYSTAAVWHRVASLFGHDVPWSLAWFTAICRSAGGVAGMDRGTRARRRALGGGARGTGRRAPARAPSAHHGFMLRYDALGVLLIASHMMLGTGRAVRDGAA
jgi:hypothetical protein